MNKKFKAYLALLTSIVMLAGMFSFNVSAGSEPNLIFEMDLSSYDGADVATIGNSVSGSDTTISKASASHVVPSLHSNAAGTKYLTFREGTTQTTSCALKVEDPNIAAAETLTIETWINYENFANGSWTDRVFSLGNASQRMADFVVGIGHNVYYGHGMEAGPGKSGSMMTRTIFKDSQGNSLSNQWIHLVVTRELTDIDKDNDTAKISHNIYINGELRSGSTPPSYDVTLSKVNSDDKYLVISGHNSGGPSIHGSMGGVKVYEGAFDADDAMNAYSASLEDFYPAPKVDEMIFDMDLSTYETDGKVGNSVEGNSSEVSITSSTQSPVLGTTEAGTQYLTFRKVGVQENSTAIKVVDDALAQAKELTFEAWVRFDGQRSDGNKDRGRLFGLGSGSSKIADFYLVNNNQAYFDVDSQYSNTADGSNVWYHNINTADNYDDKWTHFVVTRKLTEGATDADSDICEVRLYINGAQIGKDGSFNVDMSTCDSLEKYLVIGAHGGGTGTLWGDLGDFRVYNYIVPAGEVAESYNATKDAFESTGGTVTPGPDEPDEPDIPIPPASDTLIAEFDIDSYTVGSTPTGANMYIKTRRTENDLSNTTVGEASNASETEVIKYVSVANDSKPLPGEYEAKPYDTFWGYKFPTSINEEFVLDVNVQTVGTATSRGLRLGDAFIIHDWRISINALRDDFGFHNLRYIFRKNENGYYVVDCYDLLDGEKLIKTTTTTNKSCSMLVVQQYTTYEAINTGLYANISKFKLFKYSTPKVIATNASKLTRADSELELVFEQPVDEATLTDESVTLSNAATGAPVKASIKSYDAESRKLTMTLGEYLDYNTTYKVNLAGVRSEHGLAALEGENTEFTTKGALVTVNSTTFKSGAGSAIDALGSNSNISVTVNAKSAGTGERAVTVFLALYDESGIIRDVAEATAAVGTTAKDITATLTAGIVPKTGYSAKCFVWDTAAGIRNVISAEPAVIK